jgi:hypothetical protein
MGTHAAARHNTMGGQPGAHPKALHRIFSAMLLMIDKRHQSLRLFVEVLRYPEKGYKSGFLVHQSS